MCAVLSGYRDRYTRIRDAVTETGTVLSEDDLVRIGMLDLLAQPVLVVADKVAALSPGT